MLVMKLMRHLVPSPRPYWHVDAKWICGILLLFSLVITLFLATLVKLTDEKRGPTIAALAIGSAFIRSNTPTDIEEARKEIKKQGGAIYPIPNIPSIVITEKDLELSISEIKLKIFKPLTDSLYHNGIEATADRYAADPEQKKKFINDAFALRLFTKTTHQSLKSRLLTFIIVSIVLLAALIYFSAGWGRLANPGLLLLAVGLPGSLLALFVTHPPKDDKGDGGPLGFLPADVAAEIGAPIGQTYYRLTILGAGLLVAAMMGKIISKLVSRKKPAPPRTKKQAE